MAVWRAEIKSRGRRWAIEDNRQPERTSVRSELGNSWCVDRRGGLEGSVKKKITALSGDSLQGQLC